MVSSISEMIAEPLNHSNPHFLLSTLQELRQNVEREGQITFNQWRSHIHRSDFIGSALNLAQYLALRRYDLRSLQAALIPWGLSSLGRIEPRVIPTLDAVIATLEMICGFDVGTHNRPSIEAFMEGSNLLRQHTTTLFGTAPTHRHVRIMVTLPTEAASNYTMVRELIRRGANCLRINCAHDTPEDWAKMIGHIRTAEQETGLSCKVMMDLAGPKIRTGSVLLPPQRERVFHGDTIILRRNHSPSLHHSTVDTTQEGTHCTLLSDQSGEGTEPTTACAIDQSTSDRFQTTCTIPEILDLLTPNTPVYIDDGKIRTRVIDINYSFGNGESGVLLQVTQVSPKGVKLKPEKGLNFPQTTLPFCSLTAKDLVDLDFVAANADIIGYSFVQQASDIELLQQELDKRLGNRANQPAIVAKIETAIAVSNLPELIIHAAGKQSFGVMIARGDLAVEIGYQRLAEIQEEILWLCEAAHVPVIWATQVLESLVKKGAPSRGEMTDAAMAERAECVMLNKGPFIAEAITILDDVLTRMETHQMKKTPQLRALRSW